MGSNHRPADYESSGGPRLAKKSSESVTSGCKRLQIAAARCIPGASRLFAACSTPASRSAPQQIGVAAGALFVSRASQSTAQRRKRSGRPPTLRLTAEPRRSDGLLPSARKRLSNDELSRKLTARSIAVDGHTSTSQSAVTSQRPSHAGWAGAISRDDVEPTASESSLSPEMVTPLCVGMFGGVTLIAPWNPSSVCDMSLTF